MSARRKKVPYEIARRDEAIDAQQKVITALNERVLKLEHAKHEAEAERDRSVAELFGERREVERLREVIFENAKALAIAFSPHAGKRP